MFHLFQHFHQEVLCYYVQHYALFALIDEGLHEITHLYHVYHILF